MSNYVFRENHNGLLRIIKSEYFRIFQLASFNMISHCLLSMSVVFIRIFKMGLNGRISRKSFVKLRNKKNKQKK